MVLELNRLQYTLSATAQFLIITVKFMHKVRQLKIDILNTLLVITLRILVLAVILQSSDSYFKYFLMGSYMQFLSKKNQLFLRILDPLILVFYFLRWGVDSQDVILGTTFNLLIMINILTKWYTKKKAEDKKLETLIQQDIEIKEPDNHIMDNLSQDNFKKLFNSFPDSIIIINNKKEVVFINVHFKKMMMAINKRNAFTRLLKMKNVQQRIQELDQMSKLFEERMRVAYDDEGDNKSFFKQQFDESRTDEQSSEYRPIFSTQFETVQEMLNHRILNPGDKKITKMTCTDDIENSLFSVTFKNFEKLFVLLIVQDISSFNQITHLTKIIQDKSNVLSTVSHEFRTPLTCIRILLEQNQPICSEEIMAKLIRPIRSQVESFLSMVSSLLDASVINAGKMTLALSKFDVHTLIKDVKSIMQVQAEDKNNDIIINFQGIPERITNDVVRVRQVLINLIGNSIKFTEKGKIYIGGRTLGFKQYELWVGDDGIGISSQNQTKLFTEFGKLEDPLGYNPTGVGLGLMISNTIAKKLSYDSPGLKVYSEGPGKGTKFTFLLQDFDNQTEYYKQESLIRGQKNYLYPENKVKRYESDFDVSDQVSKCSCPDILIVDDTAIILRANKFNLEKKGLRVDTATTGMECVKKVESFKSSSCGCQNYKMILLDIEMPGMSGIETTKALIQLGYQGAIVGHSGHDGEQERLECKKAGMVSYFIKPLDVEALLNWASLNKIFY